MEATIEGECRRVETIAKQPVSEDGVDEAAKALKAISPTRFESYAIKGPMHRSRLDSALIANEDSGISLLSEFLEKRLEDLVQERCSQVLAQLSSYMGVKVQEMSNSWNDYKIEQRAALEKLGQELSAALEKEHSKVRSELFTVFSQEQAEVKSKIHEQMQQFSEQVTSVTQMLRDKLVSEKQCLGQKIDENIQVSTTKCEDCLCQLKDTRCVRFNAAPNSLLEISSDSPAPCDPALWDDSSSASEVLAPGLSRNNASNATWEQVASQTEPAPNRHGDVASSDTEAIRSAISQGVPQVQTTMLSSPVQGIRKISPVRRPLSPQRVWPGLHSRGLIREHGIEQIIQSEAQASSLQASVASTTASIPQPTTLPVSAYPIPPSVGMSRSTSQGQCLTTLRGGMSGERGLSVEEMAPGDIQASVSMTPKAYAPRPLSPMSPKAYAPRPLSPMSSFVVAPPISAGSYGLARSISTGCLQSSQPPGRRTLAGVVHERGKLRTME